MIKSIADLLTWKLLHLVPGTRLGESVNYFLYDTIKIFIMLAVIIFVVAIIRSFFPPEKTRKILSYRRQYFGNVAAALLGIVTPF